MNQRGVGRHAIDDCHRTPELDGATVVGSYPIIGYYTSSGLLGHQSLGHAVRRWWDVVGECEVVLLFL
jgi:hypothetical protein